MKYIDKVINNNIIVTHNDKEKEIILMGRGLGYRKHPGDTYDESFVEKKFSLSSLQTKNSNRLIQLLNEIPSDIIFVASIIMDEAIATLGKPLNDGMVITLSDHIFNAIERGKEGIFVKNMILWDIQRFYPDEYKIGKRALMIIKEKIGFELPEDEAGFIALHIVNAQMDETVGDMYGLTKIIQEIVQIVKYSFHITFDEESVYYNRFITHLKFFAQRLMQHTVYDSNDNEVLLDVVKKQYSKAYACVLKIHDFIMKNYDYQLSKEEQLYLTIHIQQIVSKSNSSY